METAETVETVETVDTVEIVKIVEIVETLETAETVETIKNIETVETEELKKSLTNLRTTCKQEMLAHLKINLKKHIEELRMLSPSLFREGTPYHFFHL